MPAMMTGPQKTAVLCLALGEKFAGEVFKRLDRREIAAISKAMLDIETVPKEQVEEVVHEFNDALQTGRDMVTGGADQVDILAGGAHGALRYGESFSDALGIRRFVVWRNAA